MTGRQHPRHVLKSQEAESAKGGVGNSDMAIQLFLPRASTKQCLAATAACLLVNVTTLKTQEESCQVVLTTLCRISNTIQQNEN